MPALRSCCRITSSRQLCRIYKQVYLLVVTEDWTANKIVQLPCASASVSAPSALVTSLQNTQPSQLTNHLGDIEKTKQDHNKNNTKKPRKLIRQTNVWFRILLRHLARKWIGAYIYRTDCGSTTVNLFDNIIICDSLA